MEYADLSWMAALVDASAACKLRPTWSWSAPRNGEAYAHLQSFATVYSHCALSPNSPNARLTSTRLQTSKPVALRRTPLLAPASPKLRRS